MTMISAWLRGSSPEAPGKIKTMESQIRVLQRQLEALGKKDQTQNAELAALRELVVDMQFELEALRAQASIVGPQPEASRYDDPIFSAFQAAAHEGMNPVYLQIIEAMSRFSQHLTAAGMPVDVSFKVLSGENARNRTANKANYGEPSSYLVVVLQDRSNPRNARTWVVGENIKGYDRGYCCVPLQGGIREGMSALLAIYSLEPKLSEVGMKIAHTNGEGVVVTRRPELSGKETAIRLKPIGEELEVGIREMLECDAGYFYGFMSAEQQVKLDALFSNKQGLSSEEPAKFSGQVVAEIVPVPKVDDTGAVFPDETVVSFSDAVEEQLRQSAQAANIASWDADLIIEERDARAVGSLSPWYRTPEAG